MSDLSRRLRLAAFILDPAIAALERMEPELPDGRTRDIVRHETARLRNTRRALRAEARELERWLSDS